MARLIVPAPTPQSRAGFAPDAHPLHIGVGNAGAVVLDDGAQTSVVGSDLCRCTDAMGVRVLQKVAECTAQRHGPAGDQHPIGVEHREFMAQIREVGGRAVDQRFCLASSFNPSESTKIKVLPRRPASNLRAEQHSDPKSGLAGPLGDRLGPCAMRASDEPPFWWEP